jgi:hypothetical protein
VEATALQPSARKMPPSPGRTRQPDSQRPASRHPGSRLRSETRERDGLIQLTREADQRSSCLRARPVVMPLLPWQFRRIHSILITHSQLIATPSGSKVADVPQTYRRGRIRACIRSYMVGYLLMRLPALPRAATGYSLSGDRYGGGS